MKLVYLNSPFIGVFRLAIAWACQQRLHVPRVVLGCVILVGMSGALQAAGDDLTPLPKLLKQGEDGPARFHDVKAWRGSLVASAKTLDERSGKGWESNNPWKNSATFQAVFSVDFVLDEYEDEPSVWSGRVVSSNLDASFRSVGEGLKKGGAIVETFFNTSGPLESGDKLKAKLEFHRERGWSFHVETPKRKTEFTEIITLKDKKFTERREVYAYGLNGTETLPYPEKRMVLFASEQKIEGGDASNAASVPFEWDYTIYLEPTSFEELRLVIEEPTDYAKWRPETTPDASAGAFLEVKARLETIKGTTPKTKVEQFIWELANTSREPGVAMNWPLEAKDNRLDLELDATGNYFRLSNSNQKLERAVEQGFSDTVKVVPYDWGGWSTLQVTAVLTDGRRIIGKLKGKSEYGLRVPKRSPDSHIADGWKDQYKSGADDLDDDKVEGQPNNGDGFSLYEEYRGWVMDGAHLEGDPEAKDFFVLNLIGADAEPGIDLFASVSQLSVHSKLRPAEMSEEKRLMNGNRRRGAHVVDQHGVWVKTFASKSELGDDGAVTVMLKSGVAGRPGLVKGIGILGRGNEDSAFAKPFNLAASDMIFAYDRAIAHELLHSVGVEHHGKGDYKMIVGYASTRNPVNKLGRPYYGTSVDKPIDLRTEAGEDVAQRDYPEYLKFRAFMDMMMQERYLKEGAEYIQRNGSTYNINFSTPQAYADFHIEILLVYCFMHLNGVVGIEHGEHSGAEYCLMRYYFAKFYESKQAPAMGDKQYYLIEPGTERIGMEICRDKTGTGVNAPGHKPQPRFGDSEAGNCFEQICPNDAVPPS